MNDTIRGCLAALLLLGNSGDQGIGEPLKVGGLREALVIWLHSYLAIEPSDLEVRYLI